VAHRDTRADLARVDVVAHDRTGDTIVNGEPESIIGPHHGVRPGARRAIVETKIACMIPTRTTIRQAAQLARPRHPLTMIIPITRPNVVVIPRQSQPKELSQTKPSTTSPTRRAHTPATRHPRRLQVRRTLMMVRRMIGASALPVRQLNPSRPHADRLELVALIEDTAVHARRPHTTHPRGHAHQLHQLGVDEKKPIS
jgi:hypothetical protein